MESDQAKAKRVQEELEAEKKPKPLTAAQEIVILKEQCQELHDVIKELAHFTGQQRPIIKRGWKTLDPNEKQWLKGAKAVKINAPKSWEWK
jgi:hypothetical protein